MDWSDQGRSFEHEKYEFEYEMYLWELPVAGCKLIFYRFLTFSPYVLPLISIQGVHNLVYQTPLTSTVRKKLKFQKLVNYQ